jgi:hypothetical protein
MTAETLSLTFPDRVALEREHAANLAYGRAFVAGATGYAMFSPCTLVLRHPAHAAELQIACEVVMVLTEGPMRGVALQFSDRSDVARTALRVFVESGPVDTPSPAVPAAAVPATEPASEDAEADAANATDGETSAAEDEAEDEQAARKPLNLSQERQQRMRNLSPTERMRIAHGSILEERVLLERIYGSSVWEHLLRNPKISVPEVARMARKGTLPRPLLDVIADNEQWIRQSVIRRALLSNPRLNADAAGRVLRSMSSRELKLVPQQTAYPAIVRQVAQRLMRGG